MWHAIFGSGAEKLTVRISRFTLNDVTRKYEELRKKEEEGWYTGSISGVAFVICHLEDKPTFAEVAKEAKEKLVEYGYLSKADTDFVWHGYETGTDMH